MVDFLDESTHSIPNNVSLPVELIELIFRQAVHSRLGMSVDAHRERQRTGLALSLTCKVFQELVEPMLYKRIVLIRDEHLRRFEYTASTSRGVALISTHTKGLWVLCNLCAHRPDVIFEACRNLDHLALRMDAVQMLQFISRQLVPFHLKELTIINPHGRPHLQPLELERLHMVGTVLDIHMTLEKFPVATISRIPNLCIEATSGEWDGRFYFTLGLNNLLEYPDGIQERSANRIWLKVHDGVKRDWQPSDVLSEDWWRTQLSSPITQDSLKRLRVTTLDKDGHDPVGLEKALLAIDYNATHWEDSK